MNLLTQALSHWGMEVLIYLDDWLIEALYHLQIRAHRDLTLPFAWERGFLFIHAESHLTPTQMIVWLGME